MAEHFPVDTDRMGIFGHSMGGHGALILALKYPEKFKSLSAFAPIVAPSLVPWGGKTFSGYLDGNRELLQHHDTCELVKRLPEPYPGEILVDQGMVDPFPEVQLQPERFEAGCVERGQALRLRRHLGHDHGYYLISTFIEDHLHHQAKWLGLE